MAQPRAFQVGVKGAIVSDGQVLLLKRENRWSGVFWDVPGGRMEGGEDIEETLRRELREELPSIGRIEVGELLHAARVPRRFIFSPDRDLSTLCERGLASMAAYRAHQLATSS